MIHKIMRRKLFLLFIFLIFIQSIWAAYLTNKPVTVKQPDGTELQCLASGDEYHNWLHDKNNYTIIQSPTTGYYTYAVKNGESVEAGTLIAGRDNPSQRGLVPFVNISQDAYKLKRSKMFQEPETREAPTIGTINNLVVFIRFSDESEISLPTTTFEGWFNTGTSSQKSYFLEASYNQLTVNTTFYPTAVSGYVVTFQDTQPRGYYQPYNATTNTIGYTGGDNGTMRATREFDLLERATAGVAASVPIGLNIDADNDGKVDNVVYVVTGSSGAWASLLWPHQWAIYDRTVILNGKQVYTFNLQLQDFLTSDNVGVICHEFFHSLGSPDLYHYTSDGNTPVGSWDLMESNTNPPQHMGAYMKYKYGHWITSIPTISAIMPYTLNALTSGTGNVYRINSASSTTQYYLVEYRRKTGTFENSIPGSGLLVYRINTLAGNGNASGPPDEVYIYRPGGTTTANGTISTAHFSSGVGRVGINATSNPTPFLVDGTNGGLILSGIGTAGTTISFNLGNPVAGAPTCEITSPVTGTVFNIGDVINVQVTATDPAKSVLRVDFYLDGSASPIATDNSSPYTWNWNTLGVTGGDHTIRATAVDNAGLSTAHDIIVNLLAPASEGFETGNFSAYPWTQSGNLPWVVQTTDKFSGTYAAKSGTIADSQTSTMAVSLNVTTAGYISFAQKVSSESGYDYLKFYIDGTETGSWSGLGAWTTQSYAVTTGLHEFKWTYSKDTNTIAGSDCAYVDHIVFPSAIITNPPQITWSLAAITQSQATNLTGSQNLSIGNTGDQTLNYTISKPITSTTIMNESFENGGAIPTGWTQSYVTGTTAWIFAAGGNSSRPAAAYDGSYNARLYFAGTTAKVTKLVTPVLNISGSTSATLTFWHAQALWSPDQDELRVYYRTSLTGAWNLLATYTANLTAWTMETITLPSTNSTYYVAFEGTAKYGYGVCVDKVQITAQSTDTSSWLTLNSGTTVSGSILDGQPNQTVAVGFNSTGLAQGTYTSNLTLTSNSTTNATVSIPVSLTVTPPPAPIISVNQTTMNYGTILINNTSTAAFTISNTGNAVLTGNIETPAGYSVSIRSLSPARVVFENGRIAPNDKINLLLNSRMILPYSINGGSSSTFDVVFTPVAVQVYNGNTTITHNAAGVSKTISMTGQGGKPTIGISSAAFTANLAPGQSDSQSLSISNSGNMALSYNLAITGTPAWLTINNGSTASGSIAIGGAAQNITIVCNSAGMVPGIYSATIHGTSNDPSNAAYDLSVTLTVRIPVTITAPTGTETWQGGTTQAITWSYAGSGSTVDFYYSTNGGTDWISGGSISSVVGANSHDWAIPYVASTTCKIKITDSVSPNYAAISNTITLITPMINVSPTNIAFGTIQINSNAVDHFTIQNTGTANLIGNISTPEGFSVSLARGMECDIRPLSRNTLSYNMAAGSSVMFDVTFAPTAAQTYNGSITITHNAEGIDQYIALTGLGEELNLATPVNLSFVLNGDNLELHWDAVANATGYLIFGADTPNGSWSLVSTTVLNEYVQTTAGLQPYKFYKVVAVHTP